MTDEEIIRELKSIEEQYRNKLVPTFEVNISSMARSCRQHIEQLVKENAELKVQIPQWHDSRNDFPEDKRKGDEFCCKLEDKTLDLEWYEILIWDIEYQTEDIYQVPVGSMFRSLKTGKDVSDYVVAWCELPKFEE